MANSIVLGSQTDQSATFTINITEQVGGEWRYRAPTADLAALLADGALKTALLSTYGSTAAMNAAMSTAGTTVTASGGMWNFFPTDGNPQRFEYYFFDGPSTMTLVVTQVQPSSLTITSADADTLTVAAHFNEADHDRKLLTNAQMLAQIPAGALHDALSKTYDNYSIVGVFTLAPTRNNSADLGWTLDGSGKPQLYADYRYEAGSLSSVVTVTPPATLTVDAEHTDEYGFKLLAHATTVNYGLYMAGAELAPHVPAGGLRDALLAHYDSYGAMQAAFKSMEFTGGAWSQARLDAAGHVEFLVTINANADGTVSGGVYPPVAQPAKVSATACRLVYRADYDQGGRPTPLTYFELTQAQLAAAAVSGPLKDVLTARYDSLEDALQALVYGQYATIRTQSLIASGTTAEHGAIVHLDPDNKPVIRIGVGTTPGSVLIELQLLHSIVR